MKNQTGSMWKRRRLPVGETALEPMSTQNRGRTVGGPGYIDNLKPWKSGQSGNPGDRPKERPIAGRYAQFAELPVDEKTRKALKLPEGATLADAAVKSAYRRAIEGNVDALKEIREGIEGEDGSLVNANLSLYDAIVESEVQTKLPSWLKNQIVETSSKDGSNGT